MILRIEDFSQFVALKANNENWAVPPRGELHVTRELKVIAAFPPATVAASKAASRRITDATAVTSKKVRRLSLSYKFAWQGAAWRCINKTKIVYCKDKKRKGTYRTSNLKNNAPLIRAECRSRKDDPTSPRGPCKRDMRPPALVPPRHNRRSASRRRGLWLGGRQGDPKYYLRQRCSR